MARDFRKGVKQLQPLALFSQSSLTDIVLLLLIFFLLTSSFVTNFGIKVDVPKAETGATTESRFISVVVTKQGDFYVNGVQVPRAGLANSIRDARNKSAEQTLVLRADKDAVVDDAVRVMNIGKALNLRMVIATEQSSI